MSTGGDPVCHACKVPAGGVGCPQLPKDVRRAGGVGAVEAWAYVSSWSEVAGGVLPGGAFVLPVSNGRAESAAATSMTLVSGVSGLPLSVLFSVCIDPVSCVDPVGAGKFSVRKSFRWVGCAVVGAVAAPNGVASSAGADAEWASFCYLL